MTDFPKLLIVPQPFSASPLVADYLAGRGAAATFFPHRPFSIASFREKLEEVSRRFGPEERARAARALRPTSDVARQRLERFVRDGGAMVTTGQQAGLFTGPLYTIYKALTTARLAARLEQELETIIIPVFWVASEDHDWDEVNHVYVDTPSDGIQRLALTEDHPDGRPMAEQPLGAGVIEVIDAFAQAIANSGYSEDVLTLVRGSYRPDRTVAEAFSELVARLVAPFDICLTDASDPALKAASREVLRGAVLDHAAHEALLNERGEALRLAGYEPQVAVLPGAANLFRHGEGTRARLHADGDGWKVPETGRTFSTEEVVAALDDDPASFSPNVLLRPIVESAVFPTLAYVGGPGEVSYFAQINALFPAFGMLAPVIYPRGSATLVEPPLQRLLEKLDFSLQDLARPVHELIDVLARRAMPEEIGMIVEELGRSVTDGFQRLISVASAVDPTLEDALGSLRNQTLARIADSEKKVVRQLKRREEVTVAQLERVRANLRPDGVPQDRVLNVLPFIARHGFSLLEEIAEQMEPLLE